MGEEVFKTKILKLKSKEKSLRRTISRFNFEALSKDAILPESPSYVLMMDNVNEIKAKNDEIFQEANQIKEEQEEYLLNHTEKEDELEDLLDKVS